MQRILNIYKPIGLTPYDLLCRLRQQQPSLKDEVITYVGRLDPMAEGVQLFCTSPDATIVESLKGLSKEYQFSFILGVETDTYDTLGLVQAIIDPHSINLKKDSFLLEKFTGQLCQFYPPFSGVKVQGKPLHYWAKKGLLNTIKIPSHPITIKKLKTSKRVTITLDKLLTTVKKRTALVSGDFRQKDILESWLSNTVKLDTKTGYPMIYGEITCSSGTYIRQLVHEVGAYTKLGATVLHIKRTKVGDYCLKDSVPVT